MPYYRIRHSLVAKEIGRKYPQVQDVQLPISWMDPMFLEQFPNRKAPDDVLLPTPVLYKSAKVTDLLSAAAVGLSRRLLISDRFYKLLMSFNPFGLQFFSVTVIDGKEEQHPYWIVHPYRYAYQLVDFTQSEGGYFTSTNLKEQTRPIAATTATAFEAEFKLYDRELPSAPVKETLCITHVVLHEQEETGFFALHPVKAGVGFYITEALKQEIIAQKLTGMALLDVNQLFP